MPLLIYLALLFIALYLLTRIILWAIEDIGLHCCESWRGIKKFSGFVIGLRFKQCKIIIIHIPTFIIKNASYYHIECKIKSNRSSISIHQIEYYFYRFLYHHLCKNLIFNSIYRLSIIIINKYKHQFMAENLFEHALVLRILTKILSALIQHIHPYIEFTDQMKISLRCKDDLIEESSFVSKASICLINHNILSVEINEINYRNKLSITRICYLTKFKLQSKKCGIECISMLIDAITVNMNESDIKCLFDEHKEFENEERDRFITRSLLKTMWDMLQTKVIFLKYTLVSK